MIKKLLLVFLFSFCLTAFSQNKNCERFKNGTFKITDAKTKAVCIITRDGDKQTEKMENSEESFDFDIVWLDNCTYTVTPTPLTVQKKKDLLKMGTMTVRITVSTDSTYVQTVRVANKPKFRRIDEVFLVK